MIGVRNLHTSIAFLVMQLQRRRWIRVGQPAEASWGYEGYRIYGLQPA